MAHKTIELHLRPGEVHTGILWTSANSIFYISVSDYNALAATPISVEADISQSYSNHAYFGYTPHYSLNRDSAGNMFYTVSMPPNSSQIGGYNRTINIRYDVWLDNQRGIEFIISVNSWVLTYRGNGGMLSSTSNNITVLVDRTEYDAISNFNYIPTRPNYVFLGFSTSTSGPVLTGYIVQNDVTLYAIWGYAVTFKYYNGQSDEVRKVPVDSWTNLPNPSYAGYAFKGWYTAASGGVRLGLGNASYKVTSNITMHAQWTPMVLVEYNGNGGTPARTSDYVAQGSYVTMPSASRPGYAVKWWQIGSAQYAVGQSYTAVEDVVATAIWGKSCNVTYDGNDGTPGRVADNAILEGGTVYLPNATRAHYDFSGWYTTPYSGGSRVGGSGSSYQVTDTVTLYARWVAQVRVSFVTNAAMTIEDMYYSTSGLPLNLPHAVKQYFRFDGWFDAPSNGTYRGTNGSVFAPTADITLYGYWTQVGGPIFNTISSQSVQVGEWRVTDAGAGKYNIILRFTHPNASTEDYTSSSDTGVLPNEDKLPRWTVNGYLANIVNIAIELEGGAANVRIGNHAFDGAVSLTSLSAESFAGVHSLGSYAFGGCTELRYIRMGGSIISIGGYAFGGCGKMATVEMGQNTQVIGEHAFDGGLNNVGVMTIISIPQSVNTIGNEAFGYLEFKAYDQQSPLLQYTGQHTASFVGYDYVRNGTDNTLYRMSNWYVIADGAEHTLYIAYSGAMPDNLPRGAPWFTLYPQAANPRPDWITSVVIRTGCTSVGNYAFMGLENVTRARLPDTILSIGRYAFSATNLASITIPDSVISIGDGAFYNCPQLVKISLGDSVATIGDLVFEECPLLAELEIPIDMKIVSPAMFSGMTHLSRIAITRGRSGVGAAYTYALVGGAFEGTFEYTPWYKSRGNSMTVALREGIHSIGPATFFANTGISTLTIPDSVISIGGAAFMGCSALTGIIIPSNVKIVPAHAFSGCTAMTDASIGGTVTSIGDYAFFKCEALASLSIPNSVTAVGYRAFADCKALGSAVVGSSVTSIGKDVPGDGDDSSADVFADAFLGCTKLFFVFNLSTLDIAAGATTHGYVAYYAKRVFNHFESIADAEFVIVGGYAFSRIDGRDYLIGYVGEDTVLAPPAQYEYKGRTVTSYAVYEKAFLNSNITSMTLPDCITAVGKDAFRGCTNLASMTFQGTACRVIGEGAFQNCAALSSIDLPPLLRAIGARAFSDSGLVSVTIPRYVDSMGEGVFLSMNSASSPLASAVFRGATPIPAFCFMNCTHLASVQSPAVTSIGAHAYDGCTALTQTLIPDTAVFVGEGAYEGCSGLTRITIGDKTRNIGLDAFPGFEFTEYQGARITVSSKLIGYTYTGSNYIFQQQGNVFKFIINYRLHGSSAIAETETYVFTRRSTSCNLDDRSVDDNGVAVKTAMSMTHSYVDDGMTYRFKCWAAGGEGWSGAAVLPGDKYGMSIVGVNEGAENVAVLNLYARYAWDETISFYLKKYSKQPGVKFRQDIQSPEWYIGADGQQNLIPLYTVVKKHTVNDSTSIVPGTSAYGIYGAGEWSFYAMGEDGRITPSTDSPITDRSALRETYDLVGVTFDLSSCYIQSLSRTIRANLTAIPTMIYGAENRFIIDMGTQMSYSLRIMRVNPPNAIPLDKYQFQHGRFTWAKAISMDWTTWYVIKDEVGFANLTNGDFYRLLLIYVDEWQNHLRNSEAVLTGGFEFACSTIDTEQFNPIDKRVFISGTIQAEMGVQALTLSIPMTVACMQTDDTSRDNVKVIAHMSEDPADYAGFAGETAIEYSYPQSASIPAPLPQLEWETAITGYRSFSHWKVMPGGNSIYLGDTFIAIDGMHLYANWGQTEHGGGVITDTGLYSDGYEAENEFVSLKDVFPTNVSSDYRYEIEVTLIGGGGVGRGCKRQSPFEWDINGGGGGGGGAAMRFLISNIHPTDDRFNRRLGLGGKNNQPIVANKNGGDSSFILKRGSVTSSFIAGGGKGTFNGNDDVARIDEGGLGGLCSIENPLNAVISFAYNGGKGGNGGYGGSAHGTPGQDGGAATAYSIPANQPAPPGIPGKGGKTVIGQTLFVNRTYGGGGGGGCAGVSLGSKEQSQGGDGGTENRRATAPNASLGGGGGGAGGNGENPIWKYSTDGAKGLVRLAIKGGVKVNP